MGRQNNRLYSIKMLNAQIQFLNATKRTRHFRHFIRYEDYDIFHLTVDSTTDGRKRKRMIKGITEAEHQILEQPRRNRKLGE